MSLNPPIVILAYGVFPTHDRPLEALRDAGTLICCDGAANELIGRTPGPDAVVGDLDSLSEEARSAFRDRLVELPSQQSSDLEKALRWVAGKGGEEVTILGATGLREDHGLGNLLMLWTDFGLDITLLTDTGRFTVVRTARSFHSFEGQVVSLFPESSRVRITTSELLYPLRNAPVSAPYKGTSNQSLGSEFSVKTTGGAVLVYQDYPPGA
ncbi:MAG: thiamine diphosphokinase [Fidelibacterota bacterium]|nr:MAG: thiamine diphosphokinase [Candidatus Neomarinimicrobiota bacterium]